MKQGVFAVVSALALITGGAGAAFGHSEGPPGGLEGERRPRTYARLADADQARFRQGFRAFVEVERVATGLGPVFNGVSCAECHNRPVIGGSSPRFVTRFGRNAAGVFDPLTQLGGSLIQARGISTGNCSVPGEVVPPQANVSARRNTPPLFGLGLIDAIPDEVILQHADPDDRDGDGISGRANMVDGGVGRFGWKAQIAGLFDFAADAYLNEMGITSPTAPAEVNPQGGPVVCDVVPDPEDDGSDVSAFTDFITLLAPLPTERRSRAARAGRRIFRRVQCNGCHLDKLRTGDSSVRALRNRRRLPIYSDLLLHDMGPELADGIEQGEATGSEFRTPPLWGVAYSYPYLHDGRARSLGEAIAAHGGEAAESRDRFLALDDASRAALIAYLRSL